MEMEEFLALLICNGFKRHLFQNLHKCNCIALNFTIPLLLMKIIVYILSIHMIALSLIPCGDGGGDIVEIAKHFFEIEHTHSTDHKEHSKGCGDDTCSPFCICSCCSSGIDYPKNSSLQLKPLSLLVKTIPSFISTFLPSSYNNAIWQPPMFS